MSATISVLGLYYSNKDLFKDFNLPPDIDKDILVDNLLAETGELEVLYPNDVFMQFMIKQWSKKELPIWTHLLETTKYEYNPIDNYNRKETYTDIEDTSKNSETTVTGKSKTDSNGTSNVNGTVDSGNENNKSVSAYNETDFTPTERDTATQNETRQSIQSDSGTVNVNANSDSNTDETGKRTLTHELQSSGNIGVTTTQSMINQERDIAQFNIIDYIINSFKERFCLQVY